MGARTTVAFAVLMYLFAALLLASIGGLAWIVAGATLVYVANIMPFVNIDDASSEQAGAGWKRFLWLNYVVGFILTITLILAKI